MTGRLFRVYANIAAFVLTSITMLVIGHYLLEAREYFSRSGEPDARLLPIDMRAYRALYKGKPEKEEIFDYIQQQSTHFEPYVHFVSNKIATTRVNVDHNGMRRTVKAPAPQAKKVFVFGGSTVWGTGASDDTTIPSLLQASLGNEFDVYNFGDTGYVATQELNQLMKTLADGNIPTHVIFYDGNNDGYAGGYSPAIPRDPQKIRVREDARERAKTNLFQYLLYEWFEPSNYPNLLWRIRAQRIENWENQIAGQEVERANRLVGYYEAHIRQVKSLGKEYGFKSFFFWQPNMFTPDREAVSYEKDILEEASRVFVTSQREIHHVAKQAFSGRECEGVYFIADVFNDVSEPVYLDWSHTTIEGNKIVVERMLQDIGHKLRGEDEQRSGPSLNHNCGVRLRELRTELPAITR